MNQEANSLLKKNEKERRVTERHNSPETNSPMMSTYSSKRIRITRTHVLSGTVTIFVLHLPELGWADPRRGPRVCSNRNLLLHAFAKEFFIDSNAEERCLSVEFALALPRVIKTTVVGKLYRRVVHGVDARRTLLRERQSVAVPKSCSRLSYLAPSQDQERMFPHPCWKHPQVMKTTVGTVII